MSTVKLVALCFVVGTAFAGKWPMRATPEGFESVPTSFDCAMRKFAYEHGKKLLPRTGSFEPLFYALGLNDDCDGTISGGAKAPVPTFPVPKDGAVYVSPTGKDSDDCGAQGSPCKSIQVAADKAATGSGGTVIARGGTYYLAEAVVLTAKHSGLSIQAAAGETPVMVRASAGKRQRLPSPTAEPIAARMKALRDDQ